MQVPVAGVEDVGHADPGRLAHAPDLRERLAEPGARDHAVLDDEVGASQPTAEKALLRPFQMSARSTASSVVDEVRRARRAQQVGQARGVRVDDLALTLELDDEQRGALGVPRLHARLRRLDGERVHDLHGDRQQPVAHDVGDRVAGGGERVEDGERGVRGLGERDEAQRDFQRDAEQALRAAEHPGPVRAHGLDAVAPEAHDLAVGQHGLDPEHVVARHPVLEAVRAARVEGEVAADRADGLARRVGRVGQPVARGGPADVEVDDAGLDDGGARVRVDAQDAVEPVERDDDPARHRQRPARQRRAAPARDERDALAVAEADHLDDLLARLGQHDGDRPLVEGGERVRAEGGERGRRRQQAFAEAEVAQRPQQGVRAPGRLGRRRRGHVRAVYASGGSRCQGCDIDA